MALLMLWVAHSGEIDRSKRPRIRVASGTRTLQGKLDIYSRNSRSGVQYPNVIDGPCRRGLHPAGLEPATVIASLRTPLSQPASFRTQRSVAFSIFRNRPTKGRR